MSADDVRKRLQALTDEFQNLQKDLTLVVEARQKLESQLQENKAVQKEFAGLDDDAKIYKLVGPVLLKQERPEAVQNVDKRLEFIGSEITRVEGQIQQLGKKQEEKKMEILQLQNQLQQEATAGGGA